MQYKKNDTIATPSLKFFAARAIATAKNKNEILSATTLPRDIQALIDDSPIKWDLYQTFFAIKLLKKDLAASGPFYLSDNDMKNLWSFAKVYMVALVVAGGLYNHFKTSDTYYPLSWLGLFFILITPKLAPKLAKTQIGGQSVIDISLTKLRNAIQKNRNEYIDNVLGDDILRARLDAAVNALLQPLDKYRTLETLKDLQSIYVEILSLENAAAPAPTDDLRALDFQSM